MPLHKLAVFDLDLTLTTRHLWLELSYQDLGPRRLQRLSRNDWVTDQGGVDVFQPQRIRTLFRTFTDDGWRLGVSTFNLEHVARRFLEVFDLEHFIQPSMIIASDTPGAGNKATNWGLLLDRAGISRHAPVVGAYHDDSLRECSEVKAAFPDVQVNVVLSPLSSPHPRTHVL